MQAILGNGIYGLPEASRLLGVSRPRAAAWFRKWHGSDQPSLFVSDYADFKHPAISFLDLVDAAASITLINKHHVSVQMVRRLHRRLSRAWKTKHPFAHEEFTDQSGRQVFCTLASEDGETRLLEILENQYAIPQVLLPFLNRVEYNRDTKMAQVLTLMGRVVADPRRRLGKPIVKGTGLQTAILSECYAATSSYDAVADWYNVSIEDVEEAVRFETEFSGIAA